MGESRKPYVRDCGCTHRGPGHTWERCPKHALQDDTEKLLEETFGVPQCPLGGCGDARRPKCMWEAADCPRHDVLSKWDALLRMAVAYVETIQSEDT